MRKNKQAYVNYVCPKCFHQLNKCTCEYFPPYSLIFVDEKIQDIVRILNEKGYCTNGCCESHFKGDCVTLYVTFCVSTLFKNALPDGFKYIKQGHGIGYEYPKKITEQEFNELKQQKLAELLEWAKNLDS